MKHQKPFLSQIIKKLASRIGARVVIEPKWSVVGQIAFRNGKKKYFRFSSIDLNTIGASDVAKDKDYATFFMKRMGYPTIVGKTFFSDRWAKAIGSKQTIDKAHAYARSIGFPVIVKPNSGSQGQEVALVHDKGELHRALRRVFKMDRVALVQKRITGKDYRIVVLDDEVISAYERIPLSVMGDGRSNVATLIKRKQREFIRKGRDTLIRLDDPRIKAKLLRQGMDFSSVPAFGEQIFLLDNANLSSGGDAVDVTGVIHRTWKDMAIRLTRDMGLRLCGVDVMTEGDIATPLSKYAVLEVNAAPGLDHYAQSGKRQRKIVENLYLKVLRGMGR